MKGGNYRNTSMRKGKSGAASEEVGAPTKSYGKGTKRHNMKQPAPHKGGSGGY